MMQDCKHMAARNQKRIATKFGCAVILVYALIFLFVVG